LRIFNLKSHPAKFHSGRKATGQILIHDRRAAGWIPMGIHLERIALSQKSNNPNFGTYSCLMGKTMSNVAAAA
jgi:hypothetical protein